MSIIYQLSPWALVSINFTYQFFYGAIVRHEKLKDYVSLTPHTVLMLMMAHLFGAVIGSVIFYSLFFGLTLSLVLFVLYTASYVYRVFKPESLEVFGPKSSWKEMLDYVYMNVPYIVVFVSFLFKGGL